MLSTLWRSSSSSQWVSLRRVLVSGASVAYFRDLQNKKGNILEASVDYIRKLQGEEKRMSQMKKQQDELERQNRKLQLQIQVSSWDALKLGEGGGVVEFSPWNEF